MVVEGLEGGLHGAIVDFVPMQSDQIRSAFRDYFASRGHTVVPSASLVPDALDPSVLLTTAGMQPFKPYFLGQRTPPAPRVTSTQKCFRTTDIDEVGRTARHLTLFEMMGNFSFGDYFKQGAVGFAWELVTEGWQIAPDRLWATVFGGDEQVPMDEEAQQLWLDVGAAAGADPAPRARGQLLAGRPHGAVRAVLGALPRPRRGARLRARQPGPDGCGPGCHCDRFLEFWNLVFMQYDQDEQGGLTPLPKPSIDTGAGVERVSALLQNVHSVYETDCFTPIIRAVEGWTGTRYDAGGVETRALRVLADHGRAMSFLGADGVLPGNEGRGYIMRRIVRRAVSHGGRIGLDEPFLVRLHALVVDRLGEVYPELASTRDDVAGILAAEEEGFRRTLRTGAALLDDVVARTRAAGAAADPGRRRLPAARHLRLPLRADGRAGRGPGPRRGRGRLRGAHGGPAPAGARRGTGRRRRRPRARGGLRARRRVHDDVRGLRRARRRDHRRRGRGAGRRPAAGEAADVAVLRRGRRPGRRPGLDRGRHGRAAVESVLRFDGDQALVAVLEHGTIARGATVRARVERALRAPTMANHTATHVLHRALQEVLGDHVRQRGSAVRPDKLRFDFSHGEPMTPEQLQRVEDIVNRVVVENHPVRFFETSQDEARSLGAMMLFGEKYGDVVRVVEIEDFSRELCGGTHVTRTAEIGPVKILSESSVGQGVRRIEAITSGAALEVLRERERAALAAARELRTDPERLQEAIVRLREQVRDLERKARDAGSGGDRLEELAGARRAPRRGQRAGGRRGGDRRRRADGALRPPARPPRHRRGGGARRRARTARWRSSRRPRRRPSRPASTPAR